MKLKKQHGVAAGALLDVVSFGPLWPLGNDFYPGIFFRHELAPRAAMAGGAPRRFNGARITGHSAAHHAAFA
jgi:hypothetical protein